MTDSTADDPAELGAAIRRAGLDPSGLTEHRPLPDGDRVWALPAGEAGWFDTWTRLRGVVPETGRWPVAMTSWGDDVDAVNRRGADPRTGLDQGPRAILARLGEVDVDATLDALEQESTPVTADDWADFHEEETLRRCGRAPALADLQAMLGETPTELTVERWLLRWELAEGGLAPRPGEAAYLDWFEPPGLVWVLLLPRPEPWSAAAYTGSYGYADLGPDLRPALFRRWHERYGAEPVANWNTMQQLVVTRPPTTVEEAFEVARAMSLVWPDTVVLPGVTVREHAIDLIGRDRWFLHLRP